MRRKRGLRKISHNQPWYLLSQNGAQKFCKRVEGIEFHIGSFYFIPEQFEADGRSSQQNLSGTAS